MRCEATSFILIVIAYIIIANVFILFFQHIKKYISKWAFEMRKGVERVFYNNYSWSSSSIPPLCKLA